MVWTMLYNLAFAGFAFADPVNFDASISTHNTVNTGGGTATSTNNQNQNQGQEQDASSSATTIVRQNLPEVGFVGFLNPGTPIVGTEWKFWYKKIHSRLTMKKIGMAHYGFHLSDLWISNWGGRVEFTPQGESLPRNNDDVLVAHYWPEDLPNEGDEILGSVIVVGKADVDDIAFVTDGALACKDQTMTRRIAVSEAEYIDGATIGGSIGLSGSAARAADASGAVFATGGMLGKTKTRAERVRRVKVLCMNDGPLYLTVPPPAEKFTPAPTPEVACNVEVYLKIIRKAEKEIATCWRYSYNNFFWQLEAARNNVNAFICTGDKGYLGIAMNHYYMAELNYIHGFDIKKYADSDAMIAEVEYGLASAFYARDGHVNNYWVAPKVVVHMNKKKNTPKSVAVTAYEKREIMKIRRTLERYSTHLTL
ncbi:MAG: hypothetical protein US63_C0014G0002 [Candidatus Moranbacteria bacterium GW2011_GWC2_37_8]|nr:MAG: hypothetical protein US63_C0014G0002 [Candidatus Moranbacteria bacterium GW2011_GWC2_37_8]KKQ62273.1 MAG: hypothetical protein US82_C0015G0002 [Parcubacteria group bacterium GW2011_GWC1_38_22]KKQ81155.1 MAG: hypothetical protein UT03_C0010G0010 [Candidatus Moranbacteria bacterium GW2011_GWD2_38_7]